MQQDLLGVTVGQHRRLENVALRGAGREPGRRADPLDVEHDPGQLGVIRQARELRHQRDARTGSGRHRPRTRPPRPDDHPHGRNLVLGLDDRERGLPGRLVAPVLLHVADERLRERRRRRDGVPRDDRDARHHASQSGRGIAFDEDHAGGLVHSLDVVRIVFGEVLFGEVEARLQRRHVQLDRLELLPELALERVLHLARAQHE